MCLDKWAGLSWSCLGLVTNPKAGVPEGDMGCELWFAGLRSAVCPRALLQVHLVGGGPASFSQQHNQDERA